MMRKKTKAFSAVPIISALMYDDKENLKNKYFI